GSTWYCRVLTANSNSDVNMRATPTLDGYVQKSYSLETGNTRSSNTIAQRTPAVSSILYAYKITSISTETLSTNIAGSVSTLTVGDATGQDSCTKSVSTWFCPVQVVNSNAGSIIATPTLDGYVQKSYNIGTQTTRTANTANQVSSTIVSIQYAFKIDTITTETIGTNIADSATALTVGDDTGQDSCTKSGSTWFCPVQTANSNSDANMR
ncbi:MAG: hypothetical protein QF415_17665, partial [Candidatus Undinarchaeales archaeon]|nr:hypothetical protein [Candidatus Undinarchaeales archaeon]